jgi:hypothetical protein
MSSPFQVEITAPITNGDVIAGNMKRSDMSEQLIGIRFTKKEDLP